MPNLTLLGLEDNCHNDYQCFVFDGIKSEESPDVAEFIKRWVDANFSGWVRDPIEGEDYHVNVRHISAIHLPSEHNVKEPHLQL